MNAAEAGRLEHAALTLERGRAALSTNPKQGLYWVKSALRLRATTLTRLESEQSVAAIQELVQQTTRLHLDLDMPMAPTEQNDLVVLALSLGDIDLAKKIVRLRSTSDEYPFTGALLSLLSKALGATPSIQIGQGRLTVAEELLIDDLTSIVEGRPTNLAGAEKFWSLTRKRRFSNTIHEYRNFFKPALASLQDQTAISA
jgi:hypothetical protein